MLSKHHILVVDDDESIRRIVQDVLEWEGYSVQVASDGLDALGSIEREPPSLILLDMRMPVLNGWEFVQELSKRGVRIPIIVMTAAVNAQKWADEVGADAYLAKPFDLADLIDLVARLHSTGTGASDAL
ncbi:MAG TPA: response regulator [Chloroflexota bacterium]|nr:response regulator [Chloroflexota bacterium]